MDLSSLEDILMFADINWLAILVCCDRQYGQWVLVV